MNWSTGFKLSVVVAILSATISVYAVIHQNSMTMEHSGTSQRNMATSPLTLPGDDIFGAIQEAVRQLEADPNTDWSKVDLEALRQHLIDMHYFTMGVDVISKKPISGGTQIEVKPESPRAETALKHVLQAHPPMLRMEKGWDMKVSRDGENYVIEATSPNPGDAEKIRGLGYIGLLAEGAHHTVHHWMIARGLNPHEPMKPSGSGK